jgi:hypothetical protein
MQEGRQQFQSIADYYRDTISFKKREAVNDTDLQTFADPPLIEPKFGNIADTRRAAPATEKVLSLQQQVECLEETINHKDQHIAYLEALIKQIESGRLMKLLRALKL